MIRIIGCIVAFTALCSQATGQCPPQQIGSPGTSQQDDFGSRIALAGDMLIVGDASDDGADPANPDCSSGAVWVYRRSASGEWDLRQRIVPSDVRCYDAFGAHIALDGNQLAVAATGFASTIYLYELEGDQWVEADRIASGFAGVLALRGDLLVVGAAGASAIEYSAGAAQVYRRDSGRWRLVHEIHPPAPRRHGGFGHAVAVTGPWIVIGEPAESRAEPTKEGRVHLYEQLPGGQLAEPITLYAPLTSEPWQHILYEFGSALATDGESLFIAAPRARDALWAYGAVYEYRLDGGAWRPHRTFAASGSFFLGVAIAVTDRHLYALEERYARTRQFDRADGRLLATLPTGSEGYRSSVAADDEQVLVGVGYYGGAWHGRVWVYDAHCLSCAPDLDGDGSLTLFDYLLFADYYALGDRRADWDLDSRITIADYRAFALAFAAGCAAP